MPQTYAARILSGHELEHFLLSVQGVHGLRLAEGAVSFNAGLTVDIAAITANSCLVNGTLLAAVGATTQTMAAADGTNPRRDVVWVDTTGTIGTTTGTAAAAPALPDIGSVSGGSTVTRLALAEVYVAAGAVSVSGQITDKRQRIFGRGRTLFVQPHAIAGTATLATNRGDFGVTNIGTAAADGSAIFGLALPTNFGVLTKAVIVLSPGQTGTLRYNVATDFGANGEARTANSDSIAATDLAVTADNIVEISMLAALDGVAALDYIGLTFQREGSHANDTITDCYIIGLQLEFWP